MTAPLGGLLTAPPTVVAAGVDVFSDALRAQGAEVHDVDWRPPGFGDPADLAALALDARRAGANRTAVERLMAAGSQLVDVRPAREVLDLPDRMLLHSGPPLEWANASGPMRGALIGACLFEGWASSVEDAEQILAAGEVSLDPCHHHRTVGPMAGVTSPSMWMWCLADPVHGGRAYCNLNEGLGKVLRMGAFNEEVQERLRWMRDVLGPVLSAAVRGSIDAGNDPIDVKGILAQMLQMGDEGHNRNRAGSLMALRELSPSIVAVEGFASSDVAAVLTFAGGNEHFFLNLGMPTAKLALDAARDVPGSTMLTVMSRNGTEFGIQTAGTGNRWFTGPANTPVGLFLGDFGPEDANPDIGDSAIMETYGVGGFAMAAAPAIVRFVGGTVPDALATTERMYQLTLAENPAMQIPIMGFRGSPTGIDVLAVARTGWLPQINTGMAGRVAGTGQVGAGLVQPPQTCFEQALAALAEEARPRPDAAGPGGPAPHGTIVGRRGGRRLEGRELDGHLEALMPLAARSEMQRLVVAHDWSATPLGPVATWSATLRTSVGICLNSRFPMLLVWGPEQVMVYNDGYAAMLGDRHPGALGRPLPEVWADVWPVIRPMVEDVFAGSANYSEDLPLLMGRFGFEEETWFTFSYSPVREPDGTVVGLLDTAVETTQRVLAARRLAMLQRLGALPRSADASAAEACVNALTVLAESPTDCPLGAAYLCDPDGSQLRFVSGFGAEVEGTEPGRLLEGWALEAVASGAPVTGVGLADRWPDVFSAPASPGPAPVQVAVTLPLTAPGQDAPIGAVALGVSPRLHLDDEFRTFLGLVAGQVAAAVADARAMEQERLRATERAEIARARAQFLSEVALTLQRSVLGPTVLPEGFAAHYEPATMAMEVGGDWYDVVHLADGRTGVVVGDVVGRGLDAAAVMGQLRSAVRALLLESRSPAQVLAALDSFADHLPGAACSTVFCAVVDTRSGRLRYSNAGHLPAVLVESSGESSLVADGRGLPVGVAATGRRPEAEVLLPPGSTLLLYTDGLVERRREDLDDGIARAVAALVEARRLPPQEVADRLSEKLLGGAREDDVAYLIYRSAVRDASAEPGTVR